MKKKRDIIRDNITERKRREMRGRLKKSREGEKKDEKRQEI